MAINNTEDAKEKMGMIMADVTMWIDTKQLKINDKTILDLW